MKRRIWTITAGLAALAALIAVPAAMAAYTSAKLEVTRTATGVVVKASLDPNDDPTARVAINRTGRHAADDQPGARNRIRARARDREGARSGRSRPSARGPARRGRAGTGPGGVAGRVHRLDGASRDVGDGADRSRTDADGADVPPHDNRTAQLGPAFIAICLPPPDVPAGTPGRATFGAKVYSAELTINGVFSSVASGAWISSWVPYNPGVGTANIAGAVVAPAAIAPGAVTLSAKTSGKGATRHWSSHAGRPGARCDGDDLRRPRRQPASGRVGRAQGGCERRIHVQGQDRHVLPRTGGRGTGRRAGGVRPASSADQHRSVRQSDGERVQRAEQGRPQEEVALGSS